MATFIPERVYFKNMKLSQFVKQKKIKRKDFEIEMKGVGLEQKVIENIFKKYKKLLPSWTNFIDQSFLSDLVKEAYKELIIKKYEQIEL